MTGDGQEVDVTTEQRLVAGRYRLLSAIGTGGMGTVWRAQDALLDREVAVKEVVFPRGLSEQERENLRERTRREARSAAKLQHPSAVTVYDVVEQDGQPFLVMELVEARTLAEVVRDDGPLPADRAAQIGLAVLGALEAAHAQGIVHRDVKPGNVLLGASRRSTPAALWKATVALSFEVPDRATRCARPDKKTPAGTANGWLGNGALPGTLWGDACRHAGGRRVCSAHN